MTAATLTARERARAWRRPPILIKSAAWRYGIYIGFLAYLVLASASVEVNIPRIMEGFDRGWRFIEGFLVPDFTSRWNDIRNGLIESLTMTVTSTVVGIIISDPIGNVEARNVATPEIYLT